MEFRRVVPSDLPALATAFVAAFNAPIWQESWTEHSARECLQDLLALPRAASLAVWDKELCMGAIFGHDSVKGHGLTHEIKELFVNPQVSGQGVGQALMVRYLTEIHLRGISHIYLLAPRDTAAQDFYSRLGFRRAEQQVMMVRP